MLYGRTGGGGAEDLVGSADSGRPGDLSRTRAWRRSRSRRLGRLHHRTGPATDDTAIWLPFFRFMVFDDPSWNYKTFKFTATDGFDSDIDYTDSKLAALFNAVNPDLSPFQARGGKMIHYHGWSDPDITPLNSINYYESV